MSTASFHFIGGKGGVGKTTCAAAIGIGAAAAGHRVLVLSTDPAPSLADALSVPLSGSPRRVPLPRGRLLAAEIDARRSLDRWLAERRPMLESIAVEGMWLDREDVASLLRLSLPGIDELAALLEIAGYARDTRCDLVVVDTAPTGHTLRMLAMPQALFGIAAVFDTMREKRRVMQEALTGVWRESREDRVIGELAATARELEALLRDPVRTRISWVTLPEPMAVAESADGIAALRSAGISVSQLIVNRVTPEPSQPCGHCDARRAFEAEAIAAVPSGPAPTGIMARRVEPRGILALASIGSEIERGALEVSRPGRPRRWTATLEGTSVKPSALCGPATRLVLLGGKGGVGKTTTAAALAVSLARRSQRRKVLLISADPAHSLGDVFGVSLSDTAAPLPDGPSNLSVRELDAGIVFARLRDRYLAAVDQVFDRLRGGSAFDAAHDRSVMRRLIDLAPPGLDELAAILEITEALAGARPPWDLVVMDTAPTGHALRLLEMPRLVHDWTHALMAILLKYQQVLGVGELGGLLLNLSKTLRRLREMLADADVTTFVAVSRPAALPRLETVRLVRQLTHLGIEVPAVVINALGRGTCPVCRSAAGAQTREATAIRRTLSPTSAPRLVVHTAASIPPPHGVAALERWTRTWRAAPALGRKGRGISSKP